MNPTRLLLQKKFKQTFGAAARNAKGNLLGGLLSLLVTAAMLAVFVFLFLGFSEGFTAAGLKSELLTVTFSLVAVYQIVTDMRFLSDSVLCARDAEILRPLPLPERALLLSDLIVVYLKTALSGALLTLPVLISFGIVQGCGAAFYCGILLALAYVPMVTLLFAILLHPVYLALRRFFSGKGALLFVLALLGAAAVFFLYSRLLVVVDQLLANNRLQYLFRESNARVIRTVSQCLIPMNFVSKALAGESVALYLPLTLAAGVGAAFAIYFLARAQVRLALSRPELVRMGSRTGSSAVRPARSVFGALVRKELRSITHQRGGLSMYWLCILMMPLMSYLSYSVLDSVLIQFGIKEYAFPFLFLMISLFSLTINTFAGGMLARDERTVFKTIPVSYRVQLGAKLLVPVCATALSLAATGLLLSATGLRTAAGGGAWLAVGAALLLSLAVVFLSLNREIGGAEDAEGGMSFGIVSGLLLSLLFAAGSFVLLLAVGTSAMYFALYGACALLLILSVFLFAHRLEERMREV